MSSVSLWFFVSVMNLVARSVSRRVWDRLQAGPAPAQVLAVFEHACDLVTSDEDVIGLVLPAVGEGPLNVVVEGGPGLFGGLQAGMAAQLAPSAIVVGRLRVDVAAARVWDPRPDWEALRARRAAMGAYLPAVRDLALRRTTEESLLTLLADPSITGSDRHDAVLARAREGMDLLRRGWEGDLGALQEGAARLAGLGGGLTPGGDDFLTGLMLWAWLAHPDPPTFCQAVAEAAVPRTTLLSAAFLRVAAAGECSVAWHRLLAALAGEDETAISLAVEGVLSHGATSGADALAGFLSGCFHRSGTAGAEIL